MMTKIAFVASFVAAFVTMDVEFFDGMITRQFWNDINYSLHQADAKIFDLIRHR